MTTTASEIFSSFNEQTDLQRLHESFTFEEYLEKVRKNPLVVRNAYQRLYDMILSLGTSKTTKANKEYTRYHFFDGNFPGNEDVIHGLEAPLEKLVNVLQSAALGMGPEKRVILLHGPVGSAKSTIVRMLKKGLEYYSRTEEGALYTFEWLIDGEWERCPMNDEPLLLIPIEVREKFLNNLFGGMELRYPIKLTKELNPSCRFNFNAFCAEFDGDWKRVIKEKIRVVRVLISEKERIGIGTFQPKDEKNQDSTELTGDINYRKIAIYGSDSDPRSFAFTGEFNVANRGIMEFVEILKLDVAFLYDLLGATQEHKIKPKKFAQTDIDEVIISHSVAGNTPIMVKTESGGLRWTTFESLDKEFSGCKNPPFMVLAYNHKRQVAEWTKVKSVFSHTFSGKMLTTSQKWGCVETTPNHSIYNIDGECFYPEQKHEILAMRSLPSVETPEVIDVCDGISAFADHSVIVSAEGHRITKPAKDGWVRLNLSRHATQLKSRYSLTNAEDIKALKDLLTVIAWYVTEGHTNGDWGVVITQNDKAQLERVRESYRNITNAKGSIDSGAKTDNAWRLYLSAKIVGVFLQHHCGKLAKNKKIPDFVFELPNEFKKHFLDELILGDGNRKFSSEFSEEYMEKAFSYKTISEMLAAQVGTLTTMLGYDYSVYRHEREDRVPAYCISYVSPKRRHKRFNARLTERDVENYTVYDIECENIHNFVCGVGNVVCHNTNEAEFRKLQGNEMMEAFRDRTIKIDIPYLTVLEDEVKIYKKDFKSRKGVKFIAPHTIEVASMWAILTRLEEPKTSQLSLLQKLKLYNGKTLPGFTSDNVRELQADARREGLDGISPRYIQDHISNAMVAHYDSSSVNPFMVMNQLEEGLKGHALINSEDDMKRYKNLITVVKEEYEDIIKNEVQKAISADEDAVARLCSNYIDNVKAFSQKEKVKNPYTGKEEQPDERLMRSIEEKIDIPESRKEDFRREILNYIGSLAIEGKKFHYYTNERLQKALELKLFEDQKDTIKLKTLVSQVIDKDTQEKIEIVKSRLIKNYGYDEDSAQDVLSYVASIYARGDAKQ